MEKQDKIGLFHFATFFGLMWGVAFTCASVIFFVFRQMADKPGDPMTAREALVPCAVILALSLPGYVLLGWALRSIGKLKRV
jgi:hypothetical protein